MTEVDYARLNEQATKLYDSAFRAGQIQGADDKTTELAAHTTKGHLDLIVRMLNSALALEDAEGARLLALHARTLCARTPAVHGRVSEIVRLLNDAGLNDSSKPFMRGIVESCKERAQIALDDLGGYR